MSILMDDKMRPLFKEAIVIKLTVTQGTTAPKWAKSKWHGRRLVRFDRFCPLYTLEETRSLPSKPS